MDSNNQGGAVEPAMESGDWRTQLQPDSRQRIVNKIMETLKRHLPFSGQEGLLELKRIAVRFEEKIYSVATSQSDYLRKISLKMLTMETKSQNPIPNNPNGNRPTEPGIQMQPQVNNQVQASSNKSQPRQLLSQNNYASYVVQVSGSLPSALPEVPNLNQSSMTDATVQNSNIQNLSGITQNSVGNSIVLGVASIMLGNSQQQMQPRQSVVPQQQQQQCQNPQQYLYHQQLRQQSQNPQQYLYQQQLQHQQQQQQQGNISHSFILDDLPDIVEVQRVRFESLEMP